jgi:hypothetical protein
VKTLSLTFPLLSLPPLSLPRANSFSLSVLLSKEGRGEGREEGERGEGRGEEVKGEKEKKGRTHTTTSSQVNLFENNTRKPTKTKSCFF